MDKRSLPALFLALCLLGACTSSTGDSPNGSAEEGTTTNEEQAAVPEVLPPQDRNGPCKEDADCMETLTCVILPANEGGTCQFICRQDSDCGNGALCRDGGCQKDCAGVGEKCSEARTCCFYDENGDKQNDAACTDKDGDVRCRTVGR